MTRRLLTALCLLLAAATPAVASPWRGGAAPPSIAVYQFAAETGGVLVGVPLAGGVLTSAGPHQPFVLRTATGLPSDIGVEQILTVAGGLRVVSFDGSVFGSSDHGTTWTWSGDVGDISGGADSAPTIVAWAIDSHQPGRLIRVHDDGAVQRSLDGGMTWLSAYPFASDYGFSEGAAAFAAGSVFVSLDGRLWRSEDLGDSWQALPNPPSDAVVPAPSSASVLWATDTHGVLRSDDGGHTWVRRLSRPAIVTPSPDDAAVAWVVDRDGSALLTVDGGQTWRSVGGAPSIVGGTDPLSILLAAVFGFAPLAPIPGAPASACYVALNAVWCSDNGSTFTPDLSRMTSSFAGYGQVAFDPVRRGRAVGVTGAVAWETTDGSQSWHAFGPPGGTWFTSVAVTRAGTFVADDRGVHFRTRSSASWQLRRGPRGILRLLADPVTGTVYASAGRRLWRARRTSFRRVAAHGLRSLFTTVASVGGHGHTVVMVDSHGFLVSTDDGRHFRRIRLPKGAITVSVSPFSPTHLLASTGRGIAASADAGNTWQILVPRAITLSLVPDPAVPSRWFAVFRGAVQESRDGVTWHRYAPAATATGFFCCPLAVSPGRLWWLSSPLFSFLPGKSGIYWRRLRR
jgi:photosystem II stability/assembly factor-like uncharacterized protein